MPVPLIELPRAFAGPKFHTVMAQVVITCGCGNNDPMVIPYMSRMDVSVTCGVCRRSYRIGRFLWKIGMQHPEVDLMTREPDIQLAGAGVPQS